MYFWVFLLAYLMEPTSPGVFKLLKPKEKELVYVIKCDEEFTRDGYVWQAFKMSDRLGSAKNQRYYYCCMTCGYYLNVAKKNKLSFNTKHPHNPFVNVNNSVSPQVDNVEENEAPRILLYYLIKFICHSNVAFVQASSKFLTALVREAIILARLFKNIEPEILFPEISDAKLSESVNAMGYNKNDKLLDDLKGQQVSILFDAGKSLFIYLSFYVSYSFFFPFFFSFYFSKGDLLLY
jgi:hypothetical protein